MNLEPKYCAPSELTLHVTNILGEAGRTWLKNLPEFIDNIEKQWDIVVGKPWDAGEFNYVAPAIRAGREDVVVKFSPPYPDGEHFREAAYLRRRNGNGAVRLLEQNHELRGMLLERALPGKNLSEEFVHNKSGVIKPAIAVLRSLIATPPADEKDVIILDDWFDGLRRFSTTSFPSAYAKKALLFYENLSVVGTPSYLHGDFHPANIVNATREPFLVIDPKGIIGNVGYDIGVFLNNYHWWQTDCPDVVGHLSVAVTAFSEAFDMPEKVVREWAFATCVLGAWWTFDEMPDIYSNEVAKADIWRV